jgi:hypothetical protein
VTGDVSRFDFDDGSDHEQASRPSIDADHSAFSRDHRRAADDPGK